MRNIPLAFVFVLSTVLSGCITLEKDVRQRQVASVLEYLFPGAESPPPAASPTAEITVPFRIGVAFVPDASSSPFRLPENERLKLADQVRDAFRNYPFVKEIIAVPSIYLVPGGGFANLSQVAALLNLDVIALVSFDQVQNAGPTGWSFMYWTGIGAYVINGDQYDILTAVEATVFDVRSHKLLLRAGGISNIKGSAPMVGFSEKAREARSRGFEEAVKDMIQKLHEETRSFRERAPKDPTIRLILPPGYKP